MCSRTASRRRSSAFSLVNIPIERAERPLFAGKAIEPDVQTNEHLEGRIYLMVLDDLHTDFTRTPRVKAAARRFIEQNFGTNDLAAVVYTGRARRVAGLHEQSAAAARGHRQVQRTQAAVGHDPAHRGRAGQSRRPATSSRATTSNRWTAPSARASVMDNIRKLAEFMAGVRGRRKAMLLIGEGIDYNIYEATACWARRPRPCCSTRRMRSPPRRAATSASTRSIRAGCRPATRISSRQSSTVGEAPACSRCRASCACRRTACACSRPSTGGFAAVNRNDLNSAFDRIVAENSSYYMFGYYSANERRDGRFRKIEVRVKRPGLRVRSRNGYFEARGRRPTTPTPPATVSPALSEAIGSPLPVTGVPIKVFAAAFKGAAPNAAIAYVAEVDINTFEFVEKDGTFSETLELVNTATDAKGKVFPRRTQLVNLNLKPDTLARAKSRGFRLVNQVSLPPGRYQMRIAAASRGGRSRQRALRPRGAGFLEGEVRDERRGADVARGRARRRPSSRRIRWPTICPVRRRRCASSRRDDTIALFAEFYENSPGAPAHMLDFKAELRAEGGRVVQNVTDQRSSTDLQGGSGGYGFSARLPLDEVAPGFTCSRRRPGAHRRSSGREPRHSDPRAIDEMSREARFHSDRRVRRSDSVPRLRPEAADSRARALQHSCARRRRSAGRGALRDRLRVRLAAARLRHHAADATAEHLLRLGGIRRQRAAAKRGGPLVLVMMVVASIAAALQNVVGAGVAYALGEHPLIGVLAGSVTLTGGPGDGSRVRAALRAGGRHRRRDARRLGGDGRHRRRRTARRTDRDLSAHRHPRRVPPTAAAERWRTSPRRGSTSRRRRRRPARTSKRTRCSNTWS